MTDLHAADPGSDVDVAVVGAGLSGVDVAYRLQTEHPVLRYTILEARNEPGGTWSLFRYPGLRSDSDMHTLGFPFDPWTGERTIAEGADILQYVKDVAARHGIDRHVRYGTRVLAADWSTARDRWVLTVERDGRREELVARFLYLAAGYYRYDQGYQPAFPGTDTFTGTLVHPQHWPADLDVAGKRFVVIGSGATAISLVPALVRQGAAQVTMLQRTPTYVLALPSVDPLAGRIRTLLRRSPRRAEELLRWRALVTSASFYRFSRTMPKAASRLLTARARRAVRGTAADDPRHFTPPYDPWDQRLCVVTDGDLFAALREGTARVVTDTVDAFVPQGVRTGSGQVLEADVVVSATGLRMQLAGGVEISIDGQAQDLSGRFVYRACMIEGVPNSAFAVGYTNASWTLRSDLSAQFFCRVVGQVLRGGYAWAAPRVEGPPLRPAPLLDLAAGYVQRSIDAFPMQGDRDPWLVRQSYLADLTRMRRADVTQEMQYGRAGDRPGESAPRWDHADPGAVP